MEEIRKAVFDMEGDKGPRSRWGFTMAFFQSCSNVLKFDLLKVFDDFYENEVLCKSINSTFIALVRSPKKLLLAGG